jgi:hypothetical protein
MFYE